MDAKNTLQQNVQNTATKNTLQQMGAVVLHYTLLRNLTLQEVCIYLLPEASGER